MQNQIAMQDAQARAQNPSGSAHEDEVDQLTETTPAPTPAPKRRKTTKKAQQGEESTGGSPQAGPSTALGGPASPPGMSLPELAAVASSIGRGPSQAPAPSGVPAPTATGHPHAHSHAHTLTGPHHHHHAPVVRPGHVHSHSHPALGHAHNHLAHQHHNHALSGGAPVASSSSASARLPAVVPGASVGGGLSLRDLSAFRDGLREELGAMREAVGRMERFVARGDQMLGLIEGALLAGVGQGQSQTSPVAGGAATSLGLHGPPAAHHHHRHHAPPSVPAPVASAPVPSVPAITQVSAGSQASPALVGGASAAPALARSTSREETTQQDLDEYLKGLPEMAAVPLPPRVGVKRVGGPFFPLGEGAVAPVMPAAAAVAVVGGEDHEMKVEPEVETVGAGVQTQAEA